MTKEPTTSAEGERTFTCTVCKATRTEKIDKLLPVATTQKTEIEAPAPNTDEPLTEEPETEAPITNVPTTNAPAVTTHRNLSDMNKPPRDDKAPDTVSDKGDSTLLIVIAALGACLGGAVVALILVMIKKKK